MDSGWLPDRLGDRLPDRLGDRLPGLVPGATAGIALGLVFALLLGATVESPVPASPPEGDDVELVTVDDDTRTWPYVSRRPSFQSQSAAVNVVVMAPPDRVRRLMMRDADSDWRIPNESDRPAEAELNVSGVTDPGESAIRWSEAGDTRRYIYVEVGNESAWRGDSYQLQVGDYLGAQHHIRVFGATEHRNVTLMQVHQEHWDWFTLSHTVDSLTDSRRYVREDLESVPAVSRVEDFGVGNVGTFDSDGTLIVVWLWLFLPAAAVTSRFRNDLERLASVIAQPAAVGLFAGVAASYLWIRAAGLAVERYELVASLDTVAAALYLALVVGPPLVATALAARLEPAPAYALGATGLSAAFVVDYAWLGISSIPTDQFLYRLAVVAALGLIAAGAARHAATRERLTLVVGYVAWVLALAWPLLGYV